MTSKRKLRKRIASLKAEIRAMRRSAIVSPPILDMRYVDVPDGVKRIAIPGIKIRDGLKIRSVRQQYPNE